MKYEYKVLAFDVKGVFGGKVDCSKMEAQLNQLGEQGWRLTKVSEALRDAGVTSKIVAFLQRSRS